MTDNTLTKKRIAQIDRQVADIVQRRCSGMPINILDIAAVFKAAYLADSGVTGEDIESAVVRTYTELSRR
jgi:hypothetical protein